MIPNCKRWLGVLLLCGAGVACAREPLVIGVENLHYLPLASHEKGVYRGFARDLLDAFAEDLGYKVEYRPLPVPRLYAALLAGQVDFKFPDNANWKREIRAGREIHYSEPVAAYVDGTSVAPARLGAGPQAIRRLGTLGGFTPWPWLERIRAGRPSLSENTSLEALVRQAVAGRVDGVYASVAVIHYQLDHVLKRPGALVFDAALPHSRDHYHLSTLRRPQVVLEFNDWMRKNRERIAALKLRHSIEKGVPAQ